MKCQIDWCESLASEGNGLCFDCTEDLAVLMHDAVLECGGTPDKALAAAEAVWK